MDEGCVHSRPFLAFDLDGTMVYTTVFPPNIDETLLGVIAQASGYDTVVSGRMLVYVRPGLRQILQNLTKRFDLGVCSYGERDYVNFIVGALDPDGTLFGNRILSREDFANSCGKYVPETWARDGWWVAVDNTTEAWRNGSPVLSVPSFDASSTTRDFERMDWRTSPTCVMDAVHTFVKTAFAIYRINHWQYCVLDSDSDGEEAGIGVGYIRPSSFADACTFLSVNCRHTIIETVTAVYDDAYYTPALAIAPTPPPPKDEGTGLSGIIGDRVMVRSRFFTHCYDSRRD